MVKIRMTRYGRKNSPYYRIGIFDTRTRRDGRYIERIGSYNPRLKDAKKRFIIKKDRLAYWLSKGAQPSNAIRLRLKKYGLL
ncbi:30S ribosomal protein S16 [Planctomycetota bacterium]